MSKDERLQSYRAKQELISKRGAQRKADNTKGLVVSVAAVALAIAGQFVYFSFGPGYVEAADLAASESTTTDAETTEVSSNSAGVPSAELAEDRLWQGAMDVAGSSIAFELDGVNAPQAVANFVDLAGKEYFEGISCHRLTTAGIFVLQCGDPNGDGKCLKHRTVVG